MNPFRRILLSTTALLALPLAAQTAGTGTLSGRVTDAQTKLALGGVHVVVPGTNLGTYTDSTGAYTLVNVPAGAQTVEFSYVGYPELRESASVTASGLATLNAAFGSGVVQMDKFVIEGSLVGSARAINQQRSAESLTSIVAADEIGRFPDQNAAESLQRLPGVALYRDQGEGRFVDLRGLNYIYTSVTLNGAKVASPEVGDRAIALDVVPADALASLEVSKVNTPDRDGEGLGGTVNIKTKSPFDFDGASADATAQVIYSDLTGKYGSKFNASASNIFADGKFGLLVSATWQERQFGSRNFEIDDGWTLQAPPGGGAPVYFLQDIAFRDYQIKRTRYGATSTLAFKPDDLTTITVSGTFNRFTDAENRHVLFLPFLRGTVTNLSGNSATVTGMSRPRRDLRNRSKDQDLASLVVTGDKKIGPWTLSGQVAVSRGHELKPAEFLARFRRNPSDVSLRYTFTDLYSVNVEQLAGPSIADPANYNAVDRLEVSREEGRDNQTNVALNARYDLGSSTFVKFGGATRNTKKVSAVDVTRYGNPASFTFASVAGITSDYPYGPSVPQISPGAKLAAFNNPPASFPATVLQPDNSVEDWTSDEKILAGYGMGGIQFGPTSVLAGVRVERTDFKTRGNQFRTAVTGLQAGRDYDNVLPSVVVRHDFNRRLVGRASYSTAIMRPAFAETAIYQSIADADLELESGNPGLKTLEARSLDASLEYYLPSLGMISAAVFHKEIDNFSYSITLPGGDPAFPTYDLITFRNGSDGKVTGLELAWQQQLRMLPAPFDGLGFMANVTFADSEATYPTRPGETLPFIGQSDRTGNFALTYEKGGFFARVALNWRNAHLREDEPIGGNDTEDRWIDDFMQLDAAVNYRLTRNVTVFAEFSNLNDEPFRVYQQGAGLAKRFVQLEEYGYTGNFGLRMKF